MRIDKTGRAIDKTAPITSAQREAPVCDRPRPSGGSVVSITNDNPSLVTTPFNVVIPAGQSSASFPIHTQQTGLTTPVNITGTYGGTNASTISSTGAISIGTGTSSDLTISSTANGTSTTPATPAAGWTALGFTNATSGLILPASAGGGGDPNGYVFFDGIHPTAEGARRAARNIWPGLERALRS